MGDEFSADPVSPRFIVNPLHNCASVRARYSLYHFDSNLKFFHEKREGWGRTAGKKNHRPRVFDIHAGDMASGSETRNDIARVE